MTTISQLPAATEVNSTDLIAVTQNSTGPGTGVGRKAAFGLIRPNARMLLQWTSGAVVINGQCYFVMTAPYSGLITALAFVTGNGSFTATVINNGLGVTGLINVAVNSSVLASLPATGANEFAAGDYLGVSINAASGSPTQAVLELAVKWN